MTSNQAMSVVIPLYNKAEYIERALSSVMSQISPAEEIVVVDDGSTDDGAGIVASRFPSVLLIQQPNAGEASARNVGVSQSRSNWVAFLDADDIWHPDHLLELRSLITEFPDSRIIATAYEIFPPRKRIRGQVLFRHGRRTVDIVRMTRNDLGAFWTSAVAVERKSFEKEGGFSLEGFGTDVDAWIRMGLKYPSAYSSRVTATYMTGNPGIMQQEKMASSVGEISSPRINGLSDLPGLCHVLEAAAPSSRRVRSSAARRYRNGRVSQALKIALRSGHDRQAMILLPLFQFPVSPKALLLILLSKVPKGGRFRLINLWLRISRSTSRTSEVS